MKRTILLVIIITIVVAVGVVYQQSTEKKVEEVSNRNQPLTEGGPDAETIKEAESINPVSLRALMEKEYDGRDFTVGRVLANEANYTRYYIT